MYGFYVWFLLVYRRRDGAAANPARQPIARILTPHRTTPHHTTPHHTTAAAAAAAAASLSA